jgi:hypothetical protein
MNQAQFYRNQAREANANAQAATLDNVRDRCLRAAAAWDAMAARVEDTERLRAERNAAAAPKLEGGLS